MISRFFTFNFLLSFSITSRHSNYRAVHFSGADKSLAPAAPSVSTSKIDDSFTLKTVPARNQPGHKSKIFSRPLRGKKGRFFLKTNKNSKVSSNYRAAGFKTGRWLFARLKRAKRSGLADGRNALRQGTGLRFSALFREGPDESLVEFINTVRLVDFFLAEYVQASLAGPGAYRSRLLSRLSGGPEELPTVVLPSKFYDYFYDVFIITRILCRSITSKISSKTGRWGVFTIKHFMYICKRVLHAKKRIVSLAALVITTILSKLRFFFVLRSQAARFLRWGGSMRTGRLMVFLCRDVQGSSGEEF